MSSLPPPPPSLHYTNTAIALHWLMAVMILVALTMGLYMVDLKISPQKLKLYSWHKWLGITIFILAAVRLWWRLRHTPPAEPPMAAWQAQAARVAHGVFYVLFFAIPLSGWIYSSAKGFQTVYLGIVPLPDLVSKNEELAVVVKQVHLFASYGLAALVGVHVAAAVQHELTDDQSLVKRMLPAKWFAQQSTTSSGELE